MNILIYGKRQQGKSTLGLALAVRRQRVIIWDPNNQYPLFASIPIERIPEWLRAGTETRQSWSIVRVGPVSTEDVESLFLQFSDLLQDERDIAIVIDEAHMLQGQGWLDPALDRWNRRSPSSVDVIQITHRIVDAHPDSRYHAHHVFFFFAYLPREIKTIRENFGEDVSLAVPTLGPHQVIHWTKQAGGLPAWYTWQDGQEWYIDLENDNAPA